MQKLLRLRVNGEAHSLSVPVNRTLLEVLREDLGLTGTKHGCELGECGACTVLLDGSPRLSCLTLAADADGMDVSTVEGLGREGKLHPLQSAFVEVGAVQCGYCTPGTLLSAFALLSRNPSPTEAEIRQALSGNICRCTGYSKIVAAVKLASGQAGARPVSARGAGTDRRRRGRS